jgi:hypothetical protein
MDGAERTNFCVPIVTRHPPVQLEYDLGGLAERDLQRCGSQYKTVTKAGSNLTYIQVELLVEIRVTQHEVNAELTFGKTVDILGNTGLPGFRLSHETMQFPPLLGKVY